MAPYIFTERRDTHIINLAKTARSLSKACDLAFDIAGRGKHLLGAHKPLGSSMFSFFLVYLFLSLFISSFAN